MAVAKEGLSYFPLDVDIFEDFKIMELLDVYGPNGLSIYIYLLTKIFHEGYYLEQPVEKVAAFAVRALGNKWITKDLVINVIHFCGDIGLLRVDYLGKGVLTSEGCQKRYAEITKRRVHRERKYWLLDPEPELNAPISPDSATESSDSATESSDSATFLGTKKRKENKRKEKERQAAVDGGAAGFKRPPAYGLPKKDCPICGGEGFVLKRDKDGHEISYYCKCRILKK